VELDFPIALAFMGHRKGKKKSRRKGGAPPKATADEPLRTTTRLPPPRKFKFEKGEVELRKKIAETKDDGGGIPHERLSVLSPSLFHIS